MHFVFIFLSFSFYLNFDVLRFCLPVEEAVQMMMMMMMMMTSATATLLLFSCVVLGFVAFFSYFLFTF